MDKIKIGKFIAEERKKQKLTQEQLAELLDVSKNAVSKWERGICLMDMSLLQPLSEILNVSVNEILAGKKINNEDLKETTEKNIIDLSKLYNLKSTQRGVVLLTIISILLIIYCAIKNISNYGFLCMILGYNAMFFYSKYKYEKNKYNLVVSNIFIVFLIICLIAFFINTNAISIDSNNLMGYLFLLLFGILLTGIGMYNVKGNISTIHWYNRRNVSKEDEKKYARLVGIGTMIIGIGCIVTTILQIIFNIEILWYLILASIILGIITILIAQIKYNKGLF